MSFFSFDFNKTLEVIFIVIYAIQQFPSFVFIFLILIHQTPFQESRLTYVNQCQEGIKIFKLLLKNRRNKVYLLLAALVWLPDEIPLVIWAEILPGKSNDFDLFLFFFLIIFLGDCIFYFLSLVDVVHIIYTSSLIFFFLFLRAEYHKNLEEEYWKTVNDINVTFFFFYF